MLTHRSEKKISGMTLALVAILGIAITAIAYTFSEGISGNDFWWHIKVGEWVVENGSVPTTDIFSWYGVANKIPWTAHEWLADVILYLVHTGLGDIGIYFLSLLAALLIPPCGVPFVEMMRLLSGITIGALSISPIIQISFLSRIPMPLICCFSLLWLTLSKKPLISTSTTK